MGIDIDIASIYSGNVRLLIAACILGTLLLALLSSLKKKNPAVKSCVKISEPASGKKNYKLCKMLSEYAANMIACGATGTQTENCTKYVADSFGLDVEMTIFPRHVLLCITDDSSEESVLVDQRIPESPLNFQRIIFFCRLAKQTWIRKLSPENFRSRFLHILRVKRLNSWLVLFLTCAANASFCRLFGGDAPAMTVVFVATGCGFYAKNALHGVFKVDIRLATIIAAFIATVIGCSSYAFQLGNTPSVALATSILYLVPGIPYINALSDLLNGQFLSCINQFFKATILTISLSIGFCLGLLSTGLRYF